MGTYIKALLFDKDGTLFDFQTTWGGWTARLLETLSEGEHVLGDQLAEVLGYDRAASGFTPDSMVIAGTPGDQITALLPLLPNWDQASLTRYITASSMQVDLQEAVPLKPLLAGFLGAGLQLGISTNDLEAAARMHLQRAEILESFTFIAGSDSGFGAKPEPGMQFGFCKALELLPEQVAMVGDSRHDLAAGRAAGMVTIAVLTGLAKAGELEDLADIVLENIGEIPAFLASSP